MIKKADFTSTIVSHLKSNADFPRIFEVPEFGYHIRHATLSDLDTLATIETQCWDRGIRTSKAQLKKRLTNYPEGQFVVTLDGDKAPVGVIYSQRIDCYDALKTTTAKNVSALHQAQGKLLQLLAVNILPEVQQQNLGDQLLEFALQYAEIALEISTVVAVTLCKSFHTQQLPIEQYIQKTDASNSLVDPILRFHQRHGANILCPIPRYRSGDKKNQGNGVLVKYDIASRQQAKLAAKKQKQSAAALTPQALELFIAAQITALLPQLDHFSLDRPFIEMGLDSLDLSVMAESISAHFAITIDALFFLRHSTTQKAVTALAPKQAVSSHQNNTRTAANKPTDIAIIGQACRLPNDVNNIDDFWQVLQSGESQLTTLPNDRWQWPNNVDLNDSHQGINLGHFFDSIKCFDADFFRISTPEAQCMDPQQRLTLELAWHTIENANLQPQAIAGSNVGVFIGASGSDYTRAIDHHAATIAAHSSTGSATASIANRISYFFDFHGPSLVIDTACSSSLVAIHQAVRAIHSNECAMAIVGGVNLMCYPATSIAYHQAGMLAPDGKCKTFDHRANGYVRGEGAVLFMLKPLQQAQADNNSILAVIKGSAVNHGGQAAGLTVPNQSQQQQLLQQAWQNAGISPSDVSYIELHGTGTKLGDPIEFGAIQDAFNALGEDSRQGNPCGLGSVKTNIGHLEAAAGAAGLLKVIACLQQQTLVANQHFERLNSKIALSEKGSDKSRLYVVENNKPWEKNNGKPRLAGVSSFGSGGGNAHIVVEQYVAPPTEGLPTQFAQGPYLFVLSAATPERLTAYARLYQVYLDQQTSEIALAAICYFLRHHRQAMRSRLVLVANSLEDLRSQLCHFIDTQQQPTITSVDSDSSNGKLQTLAMAWQSGENLDWSSLEIKQHVSNITAQLSSMLPNYPFAKTEYWFDTSLDSCDATTDTTQHTAPANQTPPVEQVTPPSNLHQLELQWQKLNDAQSNNQSNPKPCLIIGGTKAQQNQLQQHFSNAVVHEQNAANNIEQITEVLAHTQPQNIVWIAETSVNLIPETTQQFDDIIRIQQEWLIALFRWFKAADKHFDNAANVQWTIITTNSYALYPSQSSSFHLSALHGFVGSMANERPQWQLRLLDIDRAAPDHWPTISSNFPRFSRDAKPLAWREGAWHEPALISSKLPTTPNQSAYRHKGVYVVLGGAGGLGMAWTEYMLEHYDAAVVWIGRSSLNSVIQAKLDQLTEQFGKSATYVSADASQRDSLGQAQQQIKAQFGSIHGVVHATVGQFDTGFTQTSETQLLQTLSAKLETSVRAAQIFGQDNLDFLLFFSSIESFWRSGGYCGYSAGCSFIDQFAANLATHANYSVKTIHWGHWAIGSGDNIAQTTKNRLKTSGIKLLEKPESMAMLETLLASNTVNQLALIKSQSPDLLPWYQPEQYLLHSNQHSAYNIWPLSKQENASLPTTEQLKAAAVFQNKQLEQWLVATCAPLLKNAQIDVTAPHYYTQWLQATKGLLVNTSSTITEFADEQWRDYVNTLDNASVKTAIDLVTQCVTALPEILTGKQHALDLMFPEGSSHRVASIYENNAIADYFNQVMAITIGNSIANNGNSPARILEIGAGTGASSKAILGHLHERTLAVEEYRFTDISSAFLLQAQQALADYQSHLRTSVLNIEKPPQSQGIDIASYDFVLATNVLHATSDIRNTLRNAKACLKPGGIIVINELCQRSLFAHFTFGLLEGWWQHQDPALRIANTPLLSVQSWQTLLASEGFEQIYQPVCHSSHLGQQVIVARSNGVIRQRVSLSTTAPSTTQSFVSQSGSIGLIHSTAADANNSEIASTVKQLAGDLLKVAPHNINLNRPLDEYGFDSILVRQLTASLSKHFEGTKGAEGASKINSTLLFQVKTFAELVERLHAIFGQSMPIDRSLQTSARNADVHNANHNNQKHERDTIAIIGMSGRYPMAANLEQFWQNLLEGKDCISTIPAHRWAWQDYYETDPEQAITQGKSYSKWGGFIDGALDFDSAFFGITPREAIHIDPQERLFLQFAWQAMEDAGHTRAMLKQKYQGRVGVFAGITRTGFDLFGPELWAQGKVGQPRTSFSSVANRLSYLLDIHGPSLPVDTMCSSSLAAVHEACQNIRHNSCDLAFAGGVNLYLHPASYNHLSSLRMLSPLGRCDSFGHQADGFVPGEGVGVLLLKPLTQAIEDNDNIHATIISSQLNHGGKTNGYTVPNPIAQTKLISDAITQSGIDASQISYIEAHGTGTELGDPIEIDSLSDAFRQHLNADSPSQTCAIGSVKTNIGHLEAAAGIAGLTKVVLQLKHRVLVPSLHAEQLNAGINFKQTPFKLQRKASAWHIANSDTPRIAGVSSFGAGGTNVHVLLAEYHQTTRHSSSQSPTVAVLLSAKNPRSLRSYQQQLKAFVKKNEVNLVDLAYTTQTGREAFKYRSAIICSSLSELIEKLDQCDVNLAQDTQQTSAISCENKTLSELTSLWCQGAEVEWQQLYNQSTPHRISLPTYPFDQKQFWPDLPHKPETTKRKASEAKTAESLNHQGLFDKTERSTTRQPLTLSAPDILLAQRESHKMPTAVTVRELKQPPLIQPSLLHENHSLPLPPAELVCLTLNNSTTTAEFITQLQQGVKGPLAKAVLINCLTASADQQLLSAVDQVQVPVVLATTNVDHPLTKVCDLSRGEPQAKALCQQLIQAPKISLLALKKALKKPLLNLSSPLLSQAKLTYLETQLAASDSHQTPPVYIGTFHRVVELYRFDDGVAQITLNERAAKNMFSDDLCNGLRAAMHTIEQSEHYKVAVITGFDHYFCCGGTKANLLAILENKAKFTDNDIHYVAQQCTLPVIAAMQGRAIGGGWSLGLFCDLTVFSEDAKYLAPYMQYGFTPGAGSTLIFPYVLGKQLANEILLCAGEHSGHMLKNSGLQSPVLPQQQVLPFALLVAHQLTKRSRQQLIDDKKARMAPIHQAIDDAHQRELAMHELTFVGQTQVLKRINTHFRAAKSNDSPLNQQQHSAANAMPVNPESQANEKRIHQKVVSLLATELMLSTEEIDGSDQFADLGIDSIIAVSWINTLNAEFKLSLDSFEVYNYPSVEAFCQLVSQQVNTNRCTARHCATDGNAVHSTNQTASNAEQHNQEVETNILSQLRALVATELLMEEPEVQQDSLFSDMGLDSIHVVTLIRKINDHFHCKLSTNHLYNYPTLTQLTQFLASKIDDVPCAAANTTPAVQLDAARQCEAPSTTQHLSTVNTTTPQTHTSAIAVIGMAGQFPDANNVEEFWQNIAAGRDCIKPIPNDRWNPNEHFSPNKQATNKSYSKWMGVLDGIADFDPLFFNISPHEAEYMDPQQRLFLQAAWHCIEDAGYNPNDLAGSRCGVFVGCEKSDYADAAKQHGLNAYALLGSSVALLPARISYLLDLHGPCMTSDTACSASLVSIINACDSLVLGNSDLAIAGGVYVLCGAQYHIMMSKAGMLSPTGRCHTFDQQADGFVPGEGVGTLLLKRFNDALADGDNIQGIIKAWGSNQDGKTNGITAPSGKSQQRLIEDIYQRFAINVNDIQLVEAHGTGTKLGDPIEVDALNTSFKQLASQHPSEHTTPSIALGSVKSNIGHLATAAGVAASIKVLLALKHQQLPPTIHFEQLNEQIKLEDSPFFINTTCQPWEATRATENGAQQRHAAVSSFGFSGTNAHIVIAEAPARAQQPQQKHDAIYPFVLSAHSKPQLQRYIDALHRFVAQHQSNLSLADLSYTLCVSRSSMKTRLAFSFTTIEQLQKHLAEQLQQLTNNRDVKYQSHKKLTNSRDDTVYNNLDSLLSAWVSGANINWPLQQCFVAHSQRISLPVYPFAKERYWLTPVQPNANAVSTQNEPNLIQERLTIDGINWAQQPLCNTQLTARFKQKAQHPIIIIYDDIEQQKQLIERLQNIAESIDIDIEQLTKHILSFHFTNIATDRLHHAQSSIFVLSNVPTTITEVLQHAPGIQRSHVYWLTEDNASTQQLANSELAQHILLLAFDEQTSASSNSHAKPCTQTQTQAQQILLQEWLNHDSFTYSNAAKTDKKTSVTLVRYQGAQRWQFKHQPQAVKIVTRTASKSLNSVSKHWLATPLQGAKQAITSPILIIANQGNQHYLRQIFNHDNTTILVANSLECQLNHYQSAQLSADTIINTFGEQLAIIDFSDYAANASHENQCVSGKIAFYQQLVKSSSRLSLIYVTRHLHNVADDKLSLFGSEFAGLANTIAAENNHVRSKHIDIDDALYNASNQLAGVLLNELATQQQQTPICYRSNTRYQQAIKTQPITQTNPRFSADPQGIYVISGGLGGIGLQLADFLVEHGAKKLVLMGLTPLPEKALWTQQLPPELARKIAHLQRLESQTDYLGLFTGPLTNQEGLQQYFAMARQYVGPIKGVIHAAGKISDFETPAFVAKQQHQIEAVLAPKIDALNTMCQLFAEDDLTFFVAFSSLTALFTPFSRGCFDYAMANAYVERLMAYKHQHHSKAYKAVTWVDWHQTGMATRTSPELFDNVKSVLNQAGLYTHSNQEGKALFELALSQQQPWVFNCYMDPVVFTQHCQEANQLTATPTKFHEGTLSQTPAQACPPTNISEQISRWEAQLKQTGVISPTEIEQVISFEQLQTLDHSLIERVYKLLYPQQQTLPQSEELISAEVSAEHTPAVTSSPTATIPEHDEQPLNTRVDSSDLAEAIRRSVTKTLKLADVTVDNDTEFQDYGLDSISATQLALTLEQSLGIQVKSHWLIDFPTITTLTNKMLESVANNAHQQQSVEQKLNLMTK